MKFWATWWVFWFTLIILAVFGTAHADTFPSLIPSLGGGGDSLEIRLNERGIMEVVYGNTGAQSSYNGTHTLSLNGVIVDVRITVGKEVNGAETFRVTPRDPGIFSEPNEMDVLDGEVGTITLLPAMF